MTRLLFHFKLNFTIGEKLEKRQETEKEQQ